MYLTMQELVGLHRESQPEESVSQRLLLSTEAHFLIFMRRSADWLCGGISSNPDIVRDCCGKEGTEPRCKTLIFVPLVTVNDELWVVTNLHCSYPTPPLRDGVTRYDGMSLERSPIKKEPAEVVWTSSSFPFPMCIQRKHNMQVHEIQSDHLIGWCSSTPSKPQMLSTLHMTAHHKATTHITLSTSVLSLSFNRTSGVYPARLNHLSLHSPLYVLMSFGCFLSCKFVLSLSISHSLVHPPALSLSHHISMQGHKELEHMVRAGLALDWLLVHHRATY